MSKSSPFDIAGHLCTSKEDAWDDSIAYNPYMINRIMSNYNDCIFLANEMNLKYSVPKREQYTFYLNSIAPKKKRFAKWHSSKKDSDVELISQYFQVSLRKAAGLRKLMTEEDLQEISAILDKGG